MIKITLKSLVIALGVMLPMAAQGQAVKGKTFGKGFTFMTADTTASMKLHVRMQNLLEVGLNDFDSDNSNSTVKFLVRRYRLKFGGFVLDKNLRYKMELGISNRDQGNKKNSQYNNQAANIVLDAVIKYRFNKHWDLWAGQTKLPGNRERVISSANLQFVDRSRVNKDFNIDRDAGVMLHGEYEVDGVVLRPKFAVSQGEGRNITDHNFGGVSYTTRLEVLPFGKFEGKKGDYMGADLALESKPKMALGFTYNFNDRAVRQGGQLGEFVTNTATGDIVNNDLQVFFADVIFKYKGLSFMAEYANKIAKKNFTKAEVSDRYKTGEGYMAALGYVFKNNLEIAARYAKITPDNEDYSALKDRTEYTLGLSRYIVGHNLKIQSDVSLLDFKDDKQNDILFRLQVELQL